jgi:zinc protease
VQTDKTAESMQEILKELTGYTGENPATTKEVERIKLNQTRSLPGQYSTNSGFLGSIASADAYGLVFDYAAGAADRISAVTTAGLVERARNVIDTNKLTWVIVGDLEKIEESVSALGYGDIEVWDAFGNKVR